MSENFDIQHFQVDEICLYMIAYGEYGDGENTAEKRWDKWKESGFDHLVRYMSPDCCGEEEGECSFTYTACDLCGETGITGHTAVALIPK